MQNDDYLEHKTEKAYKNCLRCTNPRTKYKVIVVKERHKKTARAILSDIEDQFTNRLFYDIHGVFDPERFKAHLYVLWREYVGGKR